MNRLVAYLAAALRGPAGGMLACVLLAAMLGGIAMANPDAITGGDAPNAPRGGASHGGGSAIHGREPGGGGTGGSGDVRSDAGCRALVRHLRDDASTGHHAGLSQAIDVVSERCGSRPQAVGLLRALERLVENRERWEERHGDRPGKAADPPVHGNGGSRGSGSNSGNGSNSGSGSNSGNGSNGGNGQGTAGATTSTSTITSTGGSGGSTNGNANGGAASPNH